jgi:hypothetical protein
MKRSLRKEAGGTSLSPRAVSRTAGGALLALLAAAALSALAGPARAEEPLWGEIAETLGKGFVNVTSRGRFAETEPFRHHGGSVLLTTSRMDADVGIQYGLAPNVDLHLKVPFVSATIDEKFAGQTAHHVIGGMGELQMGAKWRFWQTMNERHKDELALMADVKLPTGDPDLTDEHGAIMPAHLQPNSGNVGLILGLAADRHFTMGGYWLSAMVTSEAPSPRYRRGDMLELHASTGRRLRPLTRADQTDWMGIFGVHYPLMGKESEGGSTLRDSGGSDLDAELGMAATRGSFGARLGVLIPMRVNYGLAHPPPGLEVQASLRSSF